MPRKVAERARAWQYVNLAELLPTKPNSSEDEMSLLQQAQAEGKLVLVQSMEQFKWSKKEIVDIESWVEAFGTLMAVIASTEPTATPHMVSHMLRVVRASRLRGSRWIDFDKEFHTKVAALGNRKCSTHYGELWDYYVTGAAATQAQNNAGGPSSQANYHPKGSGYQGDHYRQRAPKRAADSQDPLAWRRRVCYSYNFDGACVQGQVCPFLHICYTCGAEDHMSADCPNHKQKLPRKS